MNAWKHVSDTTRRRAVVAALGISVTALACLLAWLLATSTSQGSYVGGVVYDSAAVQVASAEELAASLDQKVADGMVNISINAEPMFANGAELGNLQIENSATNNYPQKVRIECNDTGQTIYTSDLIAVGSKIAMDRLDVDLDAGTYDCTAYISNIDPNTGDELGRAGADIVVSVLS